MHCHLHIRRRVDEPQQRPFHLQLLVVEVLLSIRIEEWHQLKRAPVVGDVLEYEGVVAGYRVHQHVRLGPLEWLRTV